MKTIFVKLYDNTMFNATLVEVTDDGVVISVENDTFLITWEQIKELRSYQTSEESE